MPNPRKKEDAGAEQSAALLETLAHMVRSGEVIAVGVFVLRREPDLTYFVEDHVLHKHLERFELALDQADAWIVDRRTRESDEEAE